MLDLDPRSSAVMRWRRRTRAFSSSGTSLMLENADSPAAGVEAPGSLSSKGLSSSPVVVGLGVGPREAVSALEVLRADTAVRVPRPLLSPPSAAAAPAAIEGRLDVDENEARGGLMGICGTGGVLTNELGAGGAAADDDEPVCCTPGRTVAVDTLRGCEGAPGGAPRPLGPLGGVVIVYVMGCDGACGGVLRVQGTMC